MNNTINIYFKDSEEGSVSSLENPGGQINPESTELGTQGNKAKGSMTTGKAVGMYLAKQAFSYATSHIGEWTQDTFIQNKVNSVTKITGYGVAIAINPIMGTLALGVDLITSSIDYMVKSKREINSLEISSRRAGTVNRSRI